MTNSLVADKVSTATQIDEGFYKTAFNLTVLVAGLGYFIDTFDFFMLGNMRVLSLTELGFSGDTLTKIGFIIHNCQVGGALIGSFFWGILGDKIGRKKSLLGSILIYSLCMLANSFVQDATTYAIVRFIMGFGLAGEVGLGVTLVAETVRSSKRTYALMFFTIMGVLGVVVSGACLEFMSWRACCFAGGVIGLLLLTLRSILSESHLFIEAARTNIKRGSLKELFGNIHNLKKYFLCVPLLGANFFVTGQLMILAPEIAKATDTHGIIKANIAVAIYFLAAVCGDFIGAWLSETLKSRKLVASIFILGNMCLAFLFLQKIHADLLSFYIFCAAFGMFNLWAICSTILVEQFPTELRATASTSNINFSRATLILMNSTLALIMPFGITNGLMMIGTIAFALALFCIWKLPESYGRSLVDTNT